MSEAFGNYFGVFENAKISGIDQIQFIGLVAGDVFHAIQWV
jgi:hypothetical protein